MLRFDVETISKATCSKLKSHNYKLRFDVETISKATVLLRKINTESCGLM